MGYQNAQENPFQVVLRTLLLSWFEEEYVCKEVEEISLSIFWSGSLETFYRFFWQ